MSGSTVRGFCRDRGICEHSFYEWRRRLRDGPPKTRRASRRPRFVPVRLAPASVSAIEIQFPSGHVLRVARDVDAQTLSRVVAVLDARSC